MTYFIVYIVVFLILFIWVKPFPKLHKLPLLIVFLFSLFRYDTTSDYVNYVKMFYDIQEGFLSRDIEPAFILLSKIFSFYEYGYIFVFVCFTCLAYYLIYKFLKYFNIVYWGSVFFVLFQFPFMFDNIIRQSVAIALFAYSIQYMLSNNVKKYIILNLIGFCFHYSAFICLLLYFVAIPLSKVRINKYFAVLFILILFVSYKIHLNEIVVKWLLLQTHYSYYSEYIDLFKSDTGSGITIPIKTILFIIPLFLYNNKDDRSVKIIINMSYLAGCLYLFSVSFSVMNRIVVYLYLFVVIAYAKFYSFSKMNKMLYFPLMFLAVLYVIYVGGYYGINNTYYTLFSNRCKEHLYYQRLYELGDSDKSSLSDREILYQYVR